MMRVVLEDSTLTIPGWGQPKHGLGTIHPAGLQLS